MYLIVKQNAKSKMQKAKCKKQNAKSKMQKAKSKSKKQKQKQKAKAKAKSKSKSKSKCLTNHLLSKKMFTHRFGSFCYSIRTDENKIKLSPLKIPVRLQIANSRSKTFLRRSVRSRLKSESKNKTFSKSQNNHAQIKVVQS